MNSQAATKVPQLTLIGKNKARENEAVLFRLAGDSLRLAHCRMAFDTGLRDQTDCSARRKASEQQQQDRSHVLQSELHQNPVLGGACFEVDGSPERLCALPAARGGEHRPGESSHQCHEPEDNACADRHKDMFNGVHVACSFDGFVCRV